MAPEDPLVPGIPAEGERRNPKVPDRRVTGQQLAGHLQLVAEMSTHFAASLDIQDTIQYALKLIAQYVGAEGGAVFMLEEQGTKLACRASVGPVDINGLTINSDQGIVGRCVTHNKPEMVRDVSKNPDFDQQVDKSTGFKTHSILCAPMEVKDDRIGAIELVNKQGGDRLFSEPDLMMLQSLASSAALAILNARMAEKLVGQERVRRELELANQIQRSLLPDARPAPFPVCGVNLPAREVSGDFYDFFELEDGRIYFALGDVSGKGMNAALLMSKTASLFRCLGKTIHKPGQLLAIINEEICETAIHGMFVTMAVGIFDPGSGRVLLSNAGHEPPLVHATDGSFTAIPADAPPVGIISMPDEVVPEVEIMLDGGKLYIFTDGVTEGDLEDGTRLEVEGFQKLMVENAATPIADRINMVVDLLRLDGQDRHDDITILAVEHVRS